MRQRENEVHHKRKRLTPWMEKREGPLRAGRTHRGVSAGDAEPDPDGGSASPGQSHSRLTGEARSDGRRKGTVRVPWSLPAPRTPAGRGLWGLRREQNSILLQGPLVSPQPKSPVGLSGSPPPRPRHGPQEGQLGLLKQRPSHQPHLAAATHLEIKAALGTGRLPPGIRLGPKPPPHPVGC